MNVSCWPVSTVRGDATSRQLLGVDQTYREHRAIDAIDSKRTCTSYREVLTQGRPGFKRSFVSATDWPL